MRFFHGSIRKKLIIVILLSVLPVLVTLLITELLNRSHAYSDSERDALITLKSFVEIQKRFTGSTRTLLKTISSIPDIRGFNGEKAQIILSRMLESNPVYSNVILVDIKGNVVAAGRNNTIAKDMRFSDRLQFKEAIRKKGFAAGEFLKGRSTNLPVFTFGQAVINERGNTAGVLMIGIDLHNYEEYFKKRDNLKGAYLEICDHRGIKLFGYPFTETAIGDSVESFYSNVLSGMNGSIMEIRPYKKRKKIFVFDSLKLEPDEKPYMYMYMGFDQSKISKRADWILLRMILAFILSLTAAITVAWLLAGKAIARHIENLSMVAGEYGKGNEKVELGIDYSDGEVGELARSFDSMVSTLKKRDLERIDALNQLGESERRFREIIEEVSAISIQGYDEQRRVTFWNPASEVLYGYSEEEALGKRLEDLIIPDHMKDEILQAIEMWLDDGDRIPAGELLLVDKFGNEVPVFSSHVMHKTRNGKEMFCIDIDLKPLKQSEYDKQILMDRLRQSQKMEAIGTLAGGIAHDFNNILFPILGHTEILLEEADKDDQNTLASLNQIHTSILRARDLVRQILTFSRQEITEYRPLKIQSILKEVIKLLRATLPRNIEIRKYIDYDCPMIRGDGTQIHQIVMNLATNSYHAIGDSRGDIEISLRPVEIDGSRAEITGLKKGGAVCLSVSDTGSGIDQEIMESIFDPFFTTKESGKGTGMGLSVVHGIVTNMGGAIEVRSTEEETVFEVYFPALKESETEIKAIEYIDIAFFHGKEKILFIDDEEGILKMEKTALERLGYSVTVVSDPTYAVKLFKKNPMQFDIVVTDMAMPKITGYELTSEIIKIREDIKVIMCTGFSETVSQETARGIGIREVLIKPVTIKELAGTIRKVLDEGKK